MRTKLFDAECMSWTAADEVKAQSSRASRPLRTNPQAKSTALADMQDLSMEAKILLRRKGSFSLGGRGGRTWR